MIIHNKSYKMLFNILQFIYKIQRVVARPIIFFKVRIICFD